MIDSVKIFPEKNLYAILAKNTDTLHIELRDYLVMNEFLVLDIIESNLGKRPVFFHGEFSLIPSVNLKRSGLAHQLVTASESKIEVEEYMRSKYKPPFQNQQSSFSDNNGNIDKHFTLYAELILQKAAAGEKRATDSLIDVSFAPFGTYIPLIRNVDSLASVLYRAGRTDLADKLCKKVANFSLKYITEHPFGQYYPKQVVIARLEELKAILTRYGRDQVMIHEAIQRISRQ
jgi:hypothetical protein